MTKQEWLQICRLNQEWYFRSVGLEENSIKKLMPSDSTFDDGRIEFFQKYFHPKINEDKLENLATEGFWDENSHITETWRNGFKAGYRFAKEE